MPPPHDVRRPVRLLSGLYVCGDHRDTSTVQGALFSGRRAARAVLQDFGATPGSDTPAVPAAGRLIPPASMTASEVPAIPAGQDSDMATVCLRITS